MKKIQTIKAATGKFDRVSKTVTLENREGRIWLRWTFGKRYSLSIPGGITQAAIASAYARANAIAADIALGKFDESLTAYDPSRRARAEHMQTKSQPTIRDLWERYKVKQQKLSSKTTQKSVWVEIDRALDALPKSALMLENLDRLGEEYMRLYAIATCHRHFESLQPAIRLHLPSVGLKLQLPKRVKRPIEWFSPEEVRCILQAFKTDRFSSPFAPVPHSYYHPYISFLAYTGCRPEEAIALLWSDLFWLRDRAGCEASITKVFSKSILKLYTKNHLIRNIPISPTLQSILDEQKRRSGLVFPSPRGMHIDQGNFSKRIWTPILNALVAEGEIRKKLRPYCLRHSFVTNLHYEHGVPFPTIAGLIGDRVETVIRFYSGVKPLTSQDFPNLY